MRCRVYELNTAINANAQAIRFSIPALQTDAKMDIICFVVQISAVLSAYPLVQGGGALRASHSLPQSCFHGYFTNIPPRFQEPFQKEPTRFFECAQTKGTVLAFVHARSFFILPPPFSPYNHRKGYSLSLWPAPTAHSRGIPASVCWRAASLRGQPRPRPGPSPPPPCGWEGRRTVPALSRSIPSPGRTPPDCRRGWCSIRWPRRAHRSDPAARPPA